MQKAAFRPRSRQCRFLSPKIDACNPFMDHFTEPIHGSKTHHMDHSHAIHGYPYMDHFTELVGYSLLGGRRRGHQRACSWSKRPTRPFLLSMRFSCRITWPGEGTRCPKMDAGAAINGFFSCRITWPGMRKRSG